VVAAHRGLPQTRGSTGDDGDFSVDIHARISSFRLP
jgi:hypothetical protein